MRQWKAPNIYSLQILQKVKTVNKFVGKKVKVEFYFNHVGLYFVSELKAVSSGPALVIPVSIFRIPNVPIVHNYDFSAVLYYTLDKAKVLDIRTFGGQEVKSAISQYDHSFVYEINKEVSVPDFDENRWHECAPGIHFFMSEKEALEYFNW